MLKLHTIALISHASKVMGKILQARLQQYVNCELSDVQDGFGDGQEGLACCNSWDRKESDTTEQLNWTELNINNMVF